MSAANCDVGWSSFNGSCFKVFASDPVVLLEARHKCVLDHGADLASVHSREEDLFLREMMTEATSRNQTILAFFYIGLLFTWTYHTNNFTHSEPLTNVQWMDGTPVDYGNPMAPGFQRGKQPWHAASAKWAQTPLRAEERNRVDGYHWSEHCVLMMTLEGGNGDWVDFSCNSSQGYVCRKDPKHPNTFSFPTSSTSFTAPAITLFTVLLQIYLLWLIASKSPSGMKEYRFFLSTNTLFDMLFTFVFGILLNPDLWIPYAVAGSVNGLARYFGTYGGDIAISLAVFACAGQILFEMYSLLFRFASVMEREYPKLLLLLNGWKTRVLLTVIALIMSSGLAMITLDTMDIAKITAQLLVYWSGDVIKLYSDAVLAGLPVSFIDYETFLRNIAVIVSLFVLAQLGCLCMAVRVIHYLRTNAKYFSKRTFKLQKQLIFSLMAQLLLPFLCVGLPLLSALVALCFYGIPAKQSVQLGVLMLEAYALANPLMVILFVTTYRRFTFRLLGIEALGRLLAKLISKGSTAVGPAAGTGDHLQQLQRQQQFKTTVVLEASSPLPMVT